MVTLSAAVFGTWPVVLCVTPEAVRDSTAEILSRMNVSSQYTVFTRKELVSELNSLPVV